MFDSIRQLPWKWAIRLLLISLLTPAQLFARGGEIGNGGDPVRSVFTKGHALSLEILQWLNASFLDAPIDPATKNWILNTKDAWRADLSNTDFSFVEDSRPDCIFSSASPRAPIVVSISTCHQKYWRLLESAELILELSARHMTSPAMARDASFKVGDAWNRHHDNNYWHAISPSNTDLSQRSRYRGVWLGDSDNPTYRHKMLVWGGSTEQSWDWDPPWSPPMKDGYLFDPDQGASSTWTPLAVEGEIPRPRIDFGIVWTEHDKDNPRSDRVLLWGGRGWRGKYNGMHEEIIEDLDDGAVLDTKSNHWGAMSPSPAKLRAGFSITWTGSEMVIIGGADEEHTYPYNGPTAAAYDPLTDTWRVPHLGNDPKFQRGFHTTVWTGSKILVWGGFEPNSCSTQGYVYDPVTDSSRLMSIEGAPSTRAFHTAVWTGRAMFVWGGRALDKDCREAGRLNDGAMYDPVTDRWTSPSIPQVKGVSRHQALMLDDRVMIWGGVDDNSDASFDNRVLMYDLVDNKWSITSPLGPVGRSDFVMLYTGRDVVVWGGMQKTSPYNPADFLDDGGIYVP